MKLKYLCFGLLCFVPINSISIAASPMEKFLSKLAILETEDGRSIKTYEDVNVRLNPFQKKNKKYPVYFCSCRRFFWFKKNIKALL